MKLYKKEREPSKKQEFLTQKNRIVSSRTRFKNKTDSGF